MKPLGGNETDPELNLPLLYSENHTVRDIEGSMFNSEQEKETEISRNERKIRLFKTDLVAIQGRVVTITETSTSIIETTSTTTYEIPIPCLNGGEILC